MTELTSLKKTAHITGILYFILAVLGVYNLEYLPSQIVVQETMQLPVKIF